MTEDERVEELAKRLWKAYAPEIDVEAEWPISRGWRRERWRDVARAALKFTAETVS